MGILPGYIYHRKIGLTRGIAPILPVVRQDFPAYLAIGVEYETEWMSRAEIERVRDAWLAASLDGGKRMVS